VELRTEEPYGFSDSLVDVDRSSPLKHGPDLSLLISYVISREQAEILTRIVLKRA